VRRSQVPATGGLGRLAACYLDSLATLERPAIGYGIRYEFGIFDQEIHDGWQVEKTDNWLANGNPWEIAKPDVNYLVRWGGYSEHYTDDKGRDRVRWVPGRLLKGVAYDTPIQGYGVNTCNVLTLWSARAWSRSRWTHSTPATTTRRSRTRSARRP
jgi:starch phosphorylase